MVLVLVLVDDEERGNRWYRRSAHCTSWQETVAVVMVLVLVLVNNKERGRTGGIDNRYTMLVSKRQWQ